MYGNIMYAFINTIIKAKSIFNKFSRDKYDDIDFFYF